MCSTAKPLCGFHQDCDLFTVYIAAIVGYNPTDVTTTYEGGHTCAIVLLTYVHLTTLRMKTID